MRFELPVNVQVLGDYKRIVESEDIDKIWDSNTHGNPYVIKYIRKPDIQFNFDDGKDEISFTFYPVVVCYKNKAFLIGEIEYPIDENNIKPINERPIILKQVRYLMKNYHVDELYVGVKYYELGNSYFPKLIITHNRYLVDVLFCILKPFENEIECQPELYKTIWELEQLFKKLDEIYVGLRIYNIVYPNPVFSNSTFAVDITFENRNLVTNIEFDLLSLDKTHSYMSSYSEDPNINTRFYISVNNDYTEMDPLPILLKVKLTNKYGITNTYFYNLNLIGKHASLNIDYEIYDYSYRIELEEKDPDMIALAGYSTNDPLNPMKYGSLRWPYNRWFVYVLPTSPGIYWIDVDSLYINTGIYEQTLNTDNNVIYGLRHTPNISTIYDAPPMAFFPTTALLKVNYSTDGFNVKTKDIPVTIDRSLWPDYTINTRCLDESIYKDISILQYDNYDDVANNLINSYPSDNTANVLFINEYCGYADAGDYMNYVIIDGKIYSIAKIISQPGDFVMNNFSVIRMDTMNTQSYTFFKYEYDNIRLSSIPSKDVGFILSKYYGTFAVGNPDNPREIYPESELQSCIIRYNSIKAPMSSIEFYYNNDIDLRPGSSVTSDNSSKIYTSSAIYDDNQQSLTSLSFSNMDVYTTGCFGYSTKTKHMFICSSYKISGYTLLECDTSTMTLTPLDIGPEPCSKITQFNPDVIGKIILDYSYVSNVVDDSTISLTFSNFKVFDVNTKSVSTLSNILDTTIDEKYYTYKWFIKEYLKDGSTDMFNSPSDSPSNMQTGDFLLFPIGTRNTILKTNILSLTSVSVFNNAENRSQSVNGYYTSTTNTY